MGRGLRAGIGRILIAVAIVGAGTFAWLALRTTQFESDRREAEWMSLTRSVHTVEGNTVPDMWMSGIFVSQRGLNSILALADGTIVQFDPTSRGDDTALTVKAVRLKQSQPGFPVGTVELAAESKSRNLRVDLLGEAAFVFVGIEANADGRQVARFSIQPLRLEPDLSWYSLRIGVRGYATELLATGAAVWLAKALRFDVPLPDKPAIELGKTKSERVPVRKPENENWVDLTATIAAGRIQDEISFSHPVFIDGGMWLGAQRRPGGQAALESVTRGTRTDQQLDAEISNLRAKLAQVKGPANGAGDIAVWVSGKAIDGLVQKITALPTERRTATIKSSGYQGRLADKEWRDNVLGKGGAFVEFNKPDAVHASVLLNEVNATWQARHGLAIAARAQLKGTADVHVHIDPLIGGGVGTNVGMEGNADIQASGSLQMAIITVGPQTALVLAPKMECKLATVEMRTDGRLVTDLGWTKVPSIGAKVATTELNSMLSAQVLLSDIPTVLQGRTDKGEALQAEAEGVRLLITPAWKSASARVRPLVANAGEEGFLIAAALEVSASPDRDEGAKARKEAEEKLRRDIADTLKPTDCATETSVAVTLGDIEIGPNNEIVKLLKNAWNDITKGPGKNNEVVKILKTATDAMVAAGKPLDDATKGVLNDVNDLAGKTFGENSDTTKAINVATAIARPPTVGKNEDGGITATMPGGTSVSTGGGHGGLGVTVTTPLGGKFKF